MIMISKSGAVVTTIAAHPAPAGFEAFAAGADVDRFEVFARCRAERPVFRSPTLDAWVVARHGDVTAVFRDEERFVSPKEGPGAPPYGPAMLQWRGREHQRKGGVVARRLRSPRALATFEDFIRDRCLTLIASFRDREGPVDLRAEYTSWLPVSVIGELMDVQADTLLKDWCDAIAAGSVNSIGHPERRVRSLEALDALGRLLEPVIEARREEPGEDVLSDLCSARMDGEPLRFEELRAMAAFLLTAGVETTDRVLASLLKHLFAEPERWRWLDTHRELLTSALAEAVRCFPPIQASVRFTLTDVEVAGVPIPPGEKVLLLLASGNRDEQVFDAPKEFRFDRFADHAERQFTNAAQVLSFGAGRHHCVGSQLARLEMTHALTHLLDAFEDGAFPDGVVPPDEGFLLRAPATVPVVLQQRPWR